MTRKVRGLKRKGMSSSMAGWRGPLWGSALFLSGALLLTGCPKKPVVETGRGEEVVVVKERIEVVEEAALQDVFFDFDKSVIRRDARGPLDSNVEWLKANPNVRIVIEGHADERGTNEYNLALGERRAKAGRDYLVAGGVSPQRIRTISYGEERPFCRGQNEEAWQCNRRDHFVAAK
ncbi:MAG: peptidoglycan-associated lipoprotein Pal [Candidatus Methylomirabilales bacterium]